MRRLLFCGCMAVVAIPLVSSFAGAGYGRSVMLTEATVTALASAANPSGGLLLTAPVTTAEGAGVPGGTIQFIDQTTLAVLGWADVAKPSITVASLPVGRHAIRADYSGTDSFLPLIVEPSQSQPLIVDVLSRPEVTLSSSQNPSAPGQLVTLAAKVTGASANLRGAITFRDGSSVIAAHVALDRSGAASFTTSALADGARAIVAEYEGDGEHSSALSAPLDQNVGEVRTSDVSPDHAL